MIQNDNGKTAADFEGREKIVFGLFKQRNNANKHKMDPIPVCIIPKELME